MEVGWLVSPNPQKRHLLPLYIHPTLPTSPIIISPWHTHTPELPSYLQLKVLQFWQPSAEIEANLIYFAPFSIFVPSPPLRFDSHCSARTFMLSLRPIVCSVHPDSSRRREAFRLLRLLRLDVRFSELEACGCILPIIAESSSNDIYSLRVFVFCLFISFSELCPWSYWDVFSIKASGLVNYLKSSCKLSLYENVIGKKKNTWGQTNNSEDNFNSAAWKRINPPLLPQHNTVCTCAATLGGLLKMNWLSGHAKQLKQLQQYGFAKL